MNEANSGAPLFSRISSGKRLVVTVGTGGVGKTTVSAALAIVAARAGMRTLCLTIDPARRLAQSLGYGDAASDEFTLSSTQLFGETLEGQDARGSLTVMMLDTGVTFDELIRSNSPSARAADAILDHRIYRYLSRHLAGTQSFMAMEKVLAVEESPRFDFVVVDTPPSERVLDFFDAPERMLEILESPLTEWLGRAARVGDKATFGVFRKAVSGALGSLGRIAGGGFLSDLASFLTGLSDLLGGFGSRAARVKARLRAHDVSCMLVFSPQNLGLVGAEELARGVVEREIRLDALLLNRVPEAPRMLDVQDEAVLGRAGLLELGYSEAEVEALVRLRTELERRRHDSLEAARTLLGRVRRGSPKARAFTLDDRSEPIHDPKGLVRLAESLRELD